jgi:peptidoglycan/LPS O-acetylase OafA/YrhL
VTSRPRIAANGNVSSPRGGRLEFLDALRGVAVALVLVQHVGELAFPGFGAFTHSWLLLGQMGVVVFFLCSGFIIPASLERGRDGEGRLRRLAAFWKSRFFRLFPLYWLSLAAALWLALGGGPGPATPLAPGDWVVNATMLQMLLGVPNALTVYWTLGFEMVFYGGLSALFLVGWHRRSVALSLAAWTCCLGVAVAAAAAGRAAPTGVFCLATMLTGTVFHRWHTGTVRLRRLVVCVLAAAVAAPAVLASALLTVPQPAGTPGFAAMLSAWLGAYAVFAAGVALRDRRVPAWLLHLGRISYSVYLVQAVVLLAVPPLPDPALSAAVWVLTTLAVSTVTYRFVELPAVRLGRRSSRNRTAAAGTLGAPVRLPGPLPVPAGPTSAALRPGAVASGRSLHPARNAS